MNYLYGGTSTNYTLYYHEKSCQLMVVDNECFARMGDLPELLPGKGVTAHPKSILYSDIQALMAYPQDTKVCLLRLKSAGWILVYHSLNVMTEWCDNNLHRLGT